MLRSKPYSKRLAKRLGQPRTIFGIQVFESGPRYQPTSDHRFDRLRISLEKTYRARIKEVNGYGNEYED